MIANGLEPKAGRYMKAGSVQYWDIFKKKKKSLPAEVDILN